MSDSKELKQAKADRAWWEAMSRYYGFGRLIGWTYRKHATFEHATIDRKLPELLAAKMRSAAGTPGRKSSHE